MNRQQNNINDNCDDDTFNRYHSTNKKPSFSISGTAGVSYEYYGLSRKPSGWTGFTPRKPWNQVRFNFSPEMQFGKDFSPPFNFNFALKPTNYAGPYSGISNQSFGNLSPTR